jgi:hypothetical protein
MVSRWDLLLEQKPIPILDHLLEEVTKLFSQDLGKWPLPIQELDAELGKQFEPFFAIDSKRPEPEVFREALKLARWDILRELDAQNDYMRNRRWLEYGLAEQDKLALLFIQRWLTEQLLALGESTDGRVNRAKMAEILERIGRKILPA